MKTFIVAVDDGVDEIDARYSAIQTILNDVCAEIDDMIVAQKDDDGRWHATVQFMIDGVTE